MSSLKHLAQEQVECGKDVGDKSYTYQDCEAVESLSSGIKGKVHVEASAETFGEQVEHDAVKEGEDENGEEAGDNKILRQQPAQFFQ